MNLNKAPLFLSVPLRITGMFFVQNEDTTNILSVLGSPQEPAVVSLDADENV